VFNDAGANVDFRVEGDTDANLLFVDASADVVGIGTGSPSTSKVTIERNGAQLRVRNTTTRYRSDYGVNSIGTTEINSFDDTGVAYMPLALDGNPLLLYINATERARLVGDGGGAFYLNYASRRDTTNYYSQWVQSISTLPVIEYYSNSASYSGAITQNISNRTASSAFVFLHCYSDNGADVEFNLRGDGNAYADGSWNGSGADYAEYFESNGETIPRGTTVVLDNNKVRAATENDPASSIIGVVRPKEFGKGSMVVGNLAWNMWTDKYLTDDFGVYEMEEHDVLEWEETITDEEGKTSTKSHSYESHAVPKGVTVPADATRKTHDEKGKKFQHRKLNPAWSADIEYTPREERPEWHIIGLLGQVPVLKGQPVGDRWIKMRDISETVEEWFIR
jgi:hypothetical protein